MNQTMLGSCPETPESGMKKTGKIVCGYCIMIIVAIPVVLVVLTILAKVFGYI